MRPESIRRFEQLYLGALAIGLINILISWNANLRLLSENPVLGAIGVPFLLITTIFSFAISLLLWYFVARRGSNIAKWILVVLFGFGVLSLSFTIASGSYPSGVRGVMGAVSWVMQLIGVFLLFRLDSIAWFAGSNRGVARHFE